MAAKPTMAAKTAQRLPILALAVISLLAGLWGGLLLLGLDVPTLRTTTASEHGALMALGFLGTVISLERAVALRRGWAFGAPIAAGAGGLALLTGLPDAVGWGLLCISSVILLVVYAIVDRIQSAIHLRTMAGGALCWYVATVLWFGGWTVPRLVPWLAGWLILTIIGERLELARVAILTKNSVRHFVAASSIFGAGIILASSTGQVETAGIRIAGLGLVALAVWGARYDVARRTVKIAGLTRYMAICLLSGYVWLLTAGLTWLIVGDIGQSIAIYDVSLHAVFLGFVMSMIFGHAPVIVPAVLSVRLPFKPWFYVHLALLHAALVVRLVIGDGFSSTLAWQVGGVGTEVAIVLFIIVSAAAVLNAQHQRATQRQRRVAARV